MSELPAKLQSSTIKLAAPFAGIFWVQRGVEPLIQQVISCFVRQLSWQFAPQSPQPKCSVGGGNQVMYFLTPPIIFISPAGHRRILKILCLAAPNNPNQ